MKSVFSFLSLALMLWGCGPRPGEVIATVNETPVTFGDLQSERRRSPGLSESEAFRELVLAKAVEARARALKLSLVEESAEAAPKRDAMLAMVLAHDAPTVVSAGEVAQAYRARPDLSVQPASLILAQILVGDAVLAQRLALTLRLSPERFDELARQHSIGPEAEDGGVIGKFAEEELPAALAPVAATLRAGGVSPPFTSDYGIHLLKVVRRLPRHQVSFQKSAERIRRRLIAERGPEALERWIRKHLTCEVKPEWTKRLDWTK